jgi:hypothetical protein
MPHYGLTEHHLANSDCATPICICVSENLLHTLTWRYNALCVPADLFVLTQERLEAFSVAAVDDGIELTADVIGILLYLYSQPSLAVLLSSRNHCRLSI